MYISIRFLQECLPLTGTLRVSQIGKNEINKVMVIINIICVILLINQKLKKIFN